MFKISNRPLDFKHKLSGRVRNTLNIILAFLIFLLFFLYIHFRTKEARLTIMLLWLMLLLSPGVAADIDPGGYAI